MENFGKFMFVIISMIVSPLITGFTFLKLWQWFIASTFEMQPLRLIEAIGIMFLISYVRVRRSKTDDGGIKDLAENLIFILLSSLLTLLFGFVFKQFI